MLHDTTIWDAIERNALVRGGETAFVTEGGDVTFSQFRDRARRLARRLVGLGIGRDSRVAILSEQAMPVLTLLGACSCLGAALIPFNWRSSAEEIATLLADGAPDLLVVEPKYLGAIGAFPPSRILHTGPDLIPEADGPAGARIDQRQARAAARGTALIVYTAAVDGRPRGAMLTHQGFLLSCVQQALAFSLTERDVFLGVLPLFHMSGLGGTLSTFLVGGRTLVLDRFVAPDVRQAVRRHGATFSIMFPPMLQNVLDAGEDPSDFVSMRVIMGLDSAETIERLNVVAPQVEYWVGYGQTETSGIVSYGRFRDRPGTAGRVGPLCRVAIVDDDDVELPSGEMGEIAVRGPVVFAGYWRREEENRFVARNGWHHTGDLGRLDAEGYLVYGGRTAAKELIKTGGENVYPREVEMALGAHPSIKEAVVFGMPDRTWGEAIHAVCEVEPGGEPSQADVVEFVASRLARHKRPRHVIFVASMPREGGQPDRARIKQIFARSVEAEPRGSEDEPHSRR